MLMRYRGLLVVALWQAPVGPVVTPDGSVSFLFGRGFDELVDMDCSGNVSAARTVPYAVAAVEAEHDVGEFGRVEAVAGAFTGGNGWLDGPFAAVRVRADWELAGAGGGVAILRNGPAMTPDMPRPGPGERLSYLPLPSLYLRLGSAEQLYARADMLPPLALVMQQYARLGLGWNATRRDQPSWFAGVAFTSADEVTLGGAFQGHLPLGSQFGFTLNSHYASGRRTGIWGMSVGGTYLLR